MCRTIWPGPWRSCCRVKVDSADHGPGSSLNCSCRSTKFPTACPYFFPTKGQSMLGRSRNLIAHVTSGPADLVAQGRHRAWSDLTGRLTGLQVEGVLGVAF